MSAERVIARLRELDERSGGRRVAWTDCWREERERIWAELQAAVPQVVTERDPAGNLWARLPGETDETVIVGSHLDCVPDGGWLDGCLGVLAGAEALETVARAGTPRRTLALVDWADEEGARFGHSLLGSSAAAGVLDVRAAAELRDADGTTLRDALAAHGVTVEDMPRAGAQLDDAVACLELHIEQGPVLEQQDRAACAVRGCLGVRRTAFTVTGRAVHAGATPMDLRQDPLNAAAAAVLAIRDAAVEAGVLATVGTFTAEPGTPTAVPARVRFVLDLRAAELADLEALDTRAREETKAAAEAEGCSVEHSPVWAIDPLPFDADLVARARELTGGGEPLTSGPLHDAAAVSRAGVPTAMIFVRTRGGVSHTREEDAAVADLVVGIDALVQLVTEVSGSTSA